MARAPLSEERRAARAVDLDRARIADLGAAQVGAAAGWPVGLGNLPPLGGGDRAVGGDRTPGELVQRGGVGALHGVDGQRGLQHLPVADARRLAEIGGRSGVLDLRGQVEDLRAAAERKARVGLATGRPPIRRTRAVSASTCSRSLLAICCAIARSPPSQQPSGQGRGVEVRFDVLQEQRVVDDPDVASAEAAHPWIRRQRRAPPVGDRALVACPQARTCRCTLPATRRRRPPRPAPRAPRRVSAGALTPFRAGRSMSPARNWRTKGFVGVEHRVGGRRPGRCGPSTAPRCTRRSGAPTRCRA